MATISRLDPNNLYSQPTILIGIKQLFWGLGKKQLLTQKNFLAELWKISAFQDLKPNIVTFVPYFAVLFPKYSHFPPFKPLLLLKLKIFRAPRGFLGRETSL